MAGKKPSSASRRPADDDPRVPLLSELRALLKEIDPAGLSFLIAQARTLIYNRQVDERNRSVETSAAQGVPPPRSREGNAEGIPPLRIERSDDGGTYHIVAAGKYKMFAADEMAALVRIVLSAGDEGAARRSLYRWLRTERGDALSDFGISDAAEPVLADLADLVRKRFRKPSAGKSGTSARAD